MDCLPSLRWSEGFDFVIVLFYMLVILVYTVGRVYQLVDLMRVIITGLLLGWDYIMPNTYIHYIICSMAYKQVSLYPTLC